MYGYINNYNFFNMAPEKYWAPTKNTNIKELVKNAIQSGDYFAARKVDGHWFMMLKDEDGNIILRSRTESVNGGYLNKIELVPHLRKEFERFSNGTCFIGEIFFPKNEQSRAVTTIMGCKPEKAIARQESGEKLHYYIFDCLATEGHNIMDWPMEKRIEEIKDVMEEATIKDSQPFGYCHAATYYFEDKLLDYIGYCLEQGWEGVVLQRKDGTYEPGKRPARKSIKVKKEIGNEIDCFLTGNYKPATWEYKGKEIETWPYWWNDKEETRLLGNYYEKYKSGMPYVPITKGAFFGWAGAVEIGVLKGDEVVPIGWISNVTEEIKSQIIEEPCPILHKVCKVSAMLIEQDTQALRHAKIMEWRDDINWKDCTYDKIFG